MKNLNNSNAPESLGYTQWLLQYLWALIQQSWLYKGLTTFYSTISTQWRESKINSALRADNIGELAKHSLWYRLIAKIFTPARSAKISEATESFIHDSVFVRFGSYLLHNFLALNLRFIGYFAGVATLINILLTVIASRSIFIDITHGFIAGGILIVSFIFLKFDTNVTSYFGGSGLAKFIAYSLDVKFSFDFFYKTRTKGDTRVMCAIAVGLLAGIISFVANPLIAALFVLGLVFAFLVLYRPIAGVFFTVFLAPIAPTIIMAGMCVLTLISFIIHVMRTRHFKWRFDTTGFLIINLAAVLFISAFVSFVRVTSLQIFVIYAAFISFYFVLTNLIKDRKQLYALLVTFVVSGALVAVYGVVQYLFGVGMTEASWVDDEMFATIGRRVYSTLENPNVFGTYLLLVIPVTIGLMWANRKPFTKILFAGIVGLMFVTLLLTYSRGCWIAIAVAAAMYVTFVKGKLWGFALLAIPFIPLILTLLPANIVERITSIGNLEDTSSNYRLNIWLGSIEMLRDWWVGGIGLGTDAFMQVYPFYAFSQAFASHSHNLYLQLLIEIGLVGFLMFAVVVVFALKSLSNAWSISPANPTKRGPRGAHTDKLSVMPIALGAAIIGFLVQGMFDHALYNYRVFLMFWMVIGFASLCKFIAKSEPAEGEIASE